MKRLFISFIIILFAVTTYAEDNYDFSAESPSGHTLYYKLSNGEAIVVYPRLSGSNYYYTYSKPTGYLIIPDSVPYNGVMLPVTSIGSNAFYGCTGLTSVELPPSLTTIGDNAFSNCSGLQRLVIADGAVVSLSSEQFSGCSSLRYIYIGSGVTEVGRGTFSSSVVDTLFFNARNCNCCYQQNSTTYYSSLRNLNGDNMHLIFGDSVEVLGTRAFNECSFVKDTLLLPPSLTTIGDYAFTGCTDITSLTLPPSLTTISDYAFSGCTGITSLTLPSSLTTIDNHAFNGCSGLQRLVIADGAVVSLSSSQFSGCSSLRYIYIGSGVTSIGQGTFSSSVMDTLFFNARNCNCCYQQNSVYYSSLKDLNGNNMQLILGDSVEVLGTRAFQGCSFVKDTLLLPPSLTSIGVYTFLSCTGLTSVALPPSLTSIGGSAFENCRGLTSVELPPSLTSIGSSAFKSCSRLQRLVIADGAVVSLSSSHFSGCSSLRYIYIGSGVTSIGQGTFSSSVMDTLFFNARNCNCCYQYGSNYYSSLKDLNGNNIQLIFGDSVEVLGSYAFYQHSFVQDTLLLPPSLTTIGDYAFRGCTGLTSLMLPSSLTSIGSAAFQNCSGLISVERPPSLTSIGSSAFENCTGLTSVELPPSLTSIGSNAFKGCSGLQRLVIADGAVVSLSSSQFSGCSSLRYIYIGSGVTSVGQGFSSSVVDTLFFNAKNCNCCYQQNSTYYSRLKNLNGNNMQLIFGDSVEVLGTGAFNECSFVKDTLLLPPSLTSIGSYAFNSCTGITSLTLPSSLNTIGDYAFNGCTGITSLTIPSSLTFIGNYAFQGCLGVTSLELNNNPVIIGDYAFAGCTELSSLALGNKTTIIGNSAFRNCTNLTDLTLNDSIWSIGMGAFSGSKITGTLSIPSSIQYIGDSAFYNCDNILQLDMNNSPASIGASCFRGCDRLITVNLSPNTDSIHQNAFQNCPRLINVHFGDGLRSIGNNAFKDDTRMLYSDLPSSLQTIGSNVFQNCTEFAGDITIPENVTDIGEYAFSGCKNITSLTMRPLNPPTITSTTFDSVDVNIPVYVPCGRVLYYYVADNWENFPNLLEAEPYEVTVSSNDEMMGTAQVSQRPTCNNPRARITATAQEGYHFLQWNDGNLANPRIVELSSDTTFEALFAINFISIQVHSSDTLKGSVTGTGRYYYDSPVTLRATPNSNYHFLHWSDGNTQNPRYMSATHDSTFTAVFVSNVSTITIGNNNPEMGSVSGGGVYYYQNYVTFAANPYYGYHFTQWSDGNVENPRTIMVDRDTTFTATFALNLYAVSINSVNSTMGYVSGTGNYTYNTTIGITATPNYGYHFTQWNDGNTNNPRTIVVSKDTMFTAQFAANDYQLLVSSNYPLMGSAYGTGTYSYSTQTTIAAAANYGYHFIQWSDGNTENPRVVTVTHNTEFEAQFAPNLFTITTTASNPVCGSASGGGSYNYLSSISIVATPNYGYHFTQWSDGNTENPRTITVMANGTYTAQFAINSYAIMVSPNNTGRGVVSGSGSYVYNSATTISATPYYGYHFTQWNDGSTENPRTVVITQNAQYTAQFDYNTYQLNTYSNDVSIGNVSGGGTYDYNSQVAVTAIPVPHYHFDRWNDSTTDNPRTVVLTRDTSLTAIFSIDRHNINVLSGNSLMGSTQGSGSYNYGASVFITAVPNYGYHFESWADGNTQNPRRIVVANDSNFTATFGINRYTITTASNDTLMGTVSPSATYDYNTFISLYATPAPGHHFVEWNDGITDNPRPLTVTRDSSFTARFAINTYLITAAPNDTAMGSVSGGGIYSYHEQVILTATYREHYHFVQWSDGNTSNPRVLSVSNDSTFIAQFMEDDRFEISVITTDASAGTTTGSGSYYVGTQLYISAVPDEHYLFSHWTDGSVDNPRHITVLGNVTYIACFTPKDYEISVFPNNESMGSVSGGGTFSYGSETTIGAYPREGYYFVSWNDGNEEAVRTITVDGTAVYIAEFALGEGVSDFQSTSPDITICPNPVADNLYIKLSAEYPLHNTELQVIDINGRIVIQAAATNEETTLSVTTLPAGIYLLRVNSGGACRTVKFVKE